MTKNLRIFISGVTFITGLAVGFFVFVNPLSPPVSDADSKNTAMNGSSYAQTYEDTSDLIAAIGDNGVIGYIRRSEAEEAEEEDLSPNGDKITDQLSHTISLYDKDGITVLDTFTFQYPDDIIS